MTILTEPNIRNFLLDKSQRFTPEDMHKELIEESAHSAQFSHDEIPKVETIRNWVSRYSAEMKRDVADKI
nr:13954_t:CDS:2 [Entrophospora candida]